LQQIFIEINMERYTDIKKVSKIINDKLVQNSIIENFTIKSHIDGFFVFIINKIGFSRISVGFSKYYYLEVSRCSSTLHFSELENYIYPFMKEYGLTTQKLEEMVSMYMPTEYVKFNFNQMIEPNYYGKFKFYSDADIEPFVDFLVQYYQEQHLPFVQAFDTLEKYYNYVEEKTKDRPKEWTRGWFYTQIENFFRPLLYHYFDKPKAKVFVDNIVIGPYGTEEDLIPIHEFFKRINNGSLFNLDSKQSKKTKIAQPKEGSKKVTKKDSITINLEDDIGEGNNCYVRLMEDLAALFGEYFTPTEITENWGHEEHFLVLSFRNKHAVYEFHPKDNGQYLDENIIQKAYKIALYNKMPQKLYAEENADTLSLELKFHICLPSEKEALEQRLNVSLYEYIF
jgi:hypothetical protein